MRLRPALMALVATACWASSTTTWEMNTFQDFIRGRLQGLSLNRDGRLMLAPKLEMVFSSDQAVIWSIVQASDGTLYAGTGHRGRVFQVDRSGKGTLLWTAEQPEVFALALDPNGVLYAATSPDGRVYRIQNGKAAEFFAPKTKYIWSLAFGKDGALYVGTGDQGKIFRVDAAGKGQVYYDTGQSHVTGLALDLQERLLAGTEPNGILYRISAKDKAFVLYDANLPEIRSIVAAPDGRIYAAALGGSIAKRLQGAGQPAQAGAGANTVTAPTTTITVTAEAQAGAAEIKPPADVAKPQAAQPAAGAVITPSAPGIDLSGLEKSALYRINPDNTVETLWSSKEENIYDLVTIPGQILFSTDASARIYRLSPDRKVTLVAQTNDAEATRLLPSAQGSVFAATGNMGRVYRLGDGPGTSGTFESPVHDAGTTAQWGRLSWRAEEGSGGIRFYTRSGNSAKPDRTWSDWSGALADASGSPITSPNARFIQWKAEFNGSNRGKREGTPVLSSMTLAYLPQNSPPVVKSISVTAQPAPATASKAAQQTGPVYSITVTDTGDTTASSSSGTPTQMVSRAGAQQLNVTWLAEDPDGDRLVYSLEFRGEGEREWKPLKANLHESTFLLDGDVLADGKYFFRVTASDRESNPQATAREAELVSAPVLIDNTPPVVTIGSVRKVGSGVEVAFEAADAASALRRCEYSIDAGNWRPIEAADGVIDSPREQFLLRLDAVTPGEHVLVIRAVDSGNNAGLAKLVLR